MDKKKKLKEVQTLLKLKNDADLRLYDLIKELQEKMGILENSYGAVSTFVKLGDTAKTVKEAHENTKKLAISLADRGLEIDEIRGVLSETDKYTKELEKQLLGAKNSLTELDRRLADTKKSLNKKTIAKIAKEAIDIDNLNTSIGEIEKNSKKLEEKIEKRIEKSISDSLKVFKKELDSFFEEDFYLDASKISNIKKVLPKYPPQNAGGSGATFLKSMRDIDKPTVGEPSNLDLLSFNSTKGKWEATGDIGVDSIQFDTTNTTSPIEGQMNWSSVDGTVQVGMPGGSVALQVGQEVLVKVKATEDISNGDVVYISGASGQKPEASKALADAEATSHGTIGLATEDITNNQQGYVTTFGLVRSLDTSSFTAGDDLYLSTSTSGEITNVEPADGFVVHLGNCIYSHASEGKILVRVDIVHNADEGRLATIGTATYNTIQTMQDIYHSSGLADGGAISDNGDGTYSVAAGSGYIRPTNDATDTLYAFDWSASNNITPAQTGRNYVGVEYNGGSPQIVERITYDWNYQTDFPLGEVVKEDSTLHIFNAPQKVGDHAGKMIEAMEETMPFARNNRGGGLIVGETGTRNLTLTAGSVWLGLTDFDIDAVDTSGADTFDAYYRDGVGGWTLVAGETQWNNTQYDDNSGTLATLGAAKYSVHWLYTDVESGGTLVLIYGQAEYSTVANAEEATPPASLPARLASHGRILGRLIFQKSDATATSIESVFETTFGATGVQNHNDLASLQGGTMAEYYHLTSAEYTKLGALGSLTAGSVLFADATGIQQDNSNLFWDNSNKRLGIGTTSPGAKLEIGGTSGSLLQVGTLTNDWGFNVPIGVTDGNGILLSKINAPNATSTNRIASLSRDDTFGGTLTLYDLIGDQPIKIRGNGDSYFNSGNVGIGTESPEGTLHVLTSSAGSMTAHTNGDNFIVEGAANPGMSIIGPDDQTESIILGSPTDPLGAQFTWNYNSSLATIGTSSSGASLALYAGTAEAVRVLSTGNVGIGTTGPSEKLNILSTAYNVLGLESTFAGSSGAGIITYHNSASPAVGDLVRQEWGYGNSSTGVKRLYTLFEHSIEDPTNASEDGGFRWRQMVAGTLTEVMRIGIAGNVGIGTSGPLNKLDVAGGTVIGAGYAGVNTSPTNGLLVEGPVGIGVTSPDTILDINGAFTFRELSADPSDPDEGSAVMWMSDGTGTGDDGDIIMKITAGATTKTVTIADFSAL